MSDDFVTDAELIGRLNLPEKVGRRALAALDAGVPNTRPFPQPDPRFGDRRFYPAVREWFYDYYRVRLHAQDEPTIPPWTEHFDDLEAPKAGRRERSRPALATA